MTKRYRLSIGSSIILHAILIAVFYRMKIPVMKYNEKTQFNVVFSDINTTRRPSFTSGLNGVSSTKRRGKSTKSEGKGTITRLKISPLINKEINRILSYNTDTSTGAEIPEKISSNIRKVSPYRNISIPEPKVEDVLKEVGGFPDLPESNPGVKTSGNSNSIIKWDHNGRRIVKSSPIVFPDILKSEGQDATVKAEIFVNSEGTVRKVVIIKGSGYIEVDSTVTSSLRQYLFSPSENGKEDIGIIEIHFKLKRED